MLKKIKDVIKGQLTMGATPEKLSQSFIWGVLIGIFPLLGTTTSLSALAAWIFKLNHIVIQALNYAVYPIQLLMIPIYIKIVDLFFDVGYVPLRPDLILNQFKASPVEFFKQYSLIGVYAIMVWAIFSTALYFVLYPVTLKAVKKFKKEKSNELA